MVRTAQDFQIELPSVVKPKVFKTIGRCIYCNRDGRVERLTREHVIPKGLNGTVIFSGASCESCRVLTARFEEEILRSDYKIYRALANWPITRRESPRPFGLILPNLRPVGAARSMDDISIGCFWFPLDSHERFPTQSQSFPLTSFLRLLAKIAHGIVMGETKGKGFVPCLTDLILGREENPFKYIGSASAEMLAAVPDASEEQSVVGPKPPTRTSHQVRIAAISPDGEKLMVSAFIRLFAQHPTPLYQVVVGEILPNSPLYARVAPILANANP